MMGCSNPHPHGQAWSLSYIPSEALTIHNSLKAYQEKNGSNLLLDYTQAELSSNSPRIVVRGEHFAAMIPFWATWPFEAMICPTKRQIKHVAELEEAEKQDLAIVLGKLTCRYDNRRSTTHNRAAFSEIRIASFSMLFPLFNGSLPAAKPEQHGVRELGTATFGLRSSLAQKRIGAKVPGRVRLICICCGRSADDRVHSFELLAESQRDLTAEQAAAKLQACSEEHYKGRE